MCGILAILDRPGQTGKITRHARRAEQLLDRLQHRGPDDRGSRTGRDYWLGHRRLAIVDPAGSGDQPFETGDWLTAVNGEIYNHVELRVRHGLTDLPGSDGAVIGPLHGQFGSDCIPMLDGQFAFVTVDRRRRRWLAARDPVGICPLYMGRHRDGTTWFASEMKALVDDCDHVEIVPPGHAWAGTESGIQRIKWYTPAWQDAGAAPNGPADVATLRERLIDAVVKRLMCDVPCGLLLSGGLDSSLIASIAVRYAHKAGNLKTFGDRFHTFSIGLPGAPDLEPARKVAEFLGTRHHEFHISVEDCLQAVPHVVRHLESFEQIRTAVPTYLLAQRVKATGVKMVLSGEGADEMFGGYLYFHRAPDPQAFFEETVRKVTRLHQFDVMRANKAPMAFGLEVRFPFLDRALLDYVMEMDPAEKMIQPATPGRHLEKGILRQAFHDPDRPWLPEDALFRQKEQFSDGVGYSWVDTLRERAEQRLAPGQFESRTARFGPDAPATPELYWMRELFEENFVTDRPAGPSALATVPVGRSVACSTPEALDWDPSWKSAAGDISGRAIGVHAQSGGFELEKSRKMAG